MTTITMKIEINIRIRDVIEKLCFCGSRHRAQIDGASSRGETHELHDGNITSDGAKRLRCVEVFQPSFKGKGASNFHDISFQNVMKRDVDIRKELLTNVLLSGDTSMFQ